MTARANLDTRYHIDARESNSGDNCQGLPVAFWTVLPGLGFVLPEPCLRQRATFYV